MLFDSIYPKGDLLSKLESIFSNSDAALSTQFMSYSRTVMVISTIFITSSTQWTWVWANSERVKDREAWHAGVHGVTKSWTQLSDWKTATVASSPGVDSVSRNYFLCSFIRSSTSFIKVLCWDALILLHLQALLILFWLFPPHLIYFLHWSLEPLKVIHEGWNQLLPNFC